MATFTSPGPRRAGRIGHGTSPGRLRSHSARATSARAPSRNITPRQAADNASVGSGMDVDEEGTSSSYDRIGRREALFARSEEMTVALYAALPVEVKQKLKAADFLLDPFTGEIDTVVGFSLIASPQGCFAWQHTQGVKGPPTCYIFSCPGSTSAVAPPFHKFVPYDTSREPGLILVSISGEIRFWVSIAIGLAGGQTFSRTRLDLPARETVTNFIRADPRTYLASTSLGRFFRLSVTSSGGKHHLTIHPFSRPQTSLSFTSLIPSLLSSPAAFVPAPGNVNAVTLGARVATGTDVWALIETRLQKWNLSTEGWEEAISDDDVGPIIRTALRAALPSVPDDDSALDLELLDFAFEGHTLTSRDVGKMVTLVSFAGKEEEMGIAGPRRAYALVWIIYTSENFAVERVSGVPYQSTSLSGAAMHPRLQLMHLGALIIVQFGDAVAFCARDSAYRHRLELKSTIDRTFGVGVLGSENAVLILTGSSMMKASLDMDQIHNFMHDTGQPSLIKSIMMQAIAYGSNPENTLHFSFPPEVDGESLMLAAEQLSSAVLESDHEVVRRDHDLRWQMSGRKERLSWLIGFINENGVLTKMSQRTRQKLAVDAEKLAASFMLWQDHNERLAGGMVHSILDEAVCNFMTAANEGHHDDILRAFFRLKVADIGPLLVVVVETTKKAAREPGRNMAAILPEANAVIYTVLSCAVEYRDWNKEVYGLEYPLIDPWTCTPAIINAVLDLFYLTASFVDEVSDSTADEKTSKVISQLPELARILFQSFTERLLWLGSAAVADEPEIVQERQELEERFASLRPEILETLRRHGHGAYAFSLAEQFRDFRTLVALCHKGPVYPPQENPNAERIETYIEKYRDNFTSELFQWCIAHGEVRVMFAQEDIYGPYLDRFFDKHRHSNVSWIHDLGKRRYFAAAMTLLEEARKVPDLATRQLMLSVGKLSHLAQTHEPEGELDQNVLDAFHNELDFISTHKILLAELRPALGTSKTKEPLDRQIETIAQKTATKLLDYPSLLDVFKKLLRQLLQGKALSLEDMVDALTLKDNTMSVESYTTALDLLARDKELPAVRRMSAFRTVWRRIYLHDDWEKIRQTRNIADFELNSRFERTALYAALRSVYSKDEGDRDRPEGYHVDISEAQRIPSPAEIASRWPGQPPDEVDALTADYLLESETLRELHLEDVYERVKDLALGIGMEEDVFR